MRMNILDRNNENLEVKVHILRRVSGGKVPPEVTVNCHADTTVGQLIDMLCIEYGEELRDAVEDSSIATIVNGVAHLNAKNVPLRADNESMAEVCFFFNWSNGG